MSKVKLGGLCEINFVRTGPTGRPPIVFLHAVGLDLTWWDHQVEAFGRDNDVIAIDFPSHGLSGDLTAPPSLDLITLVIEKFLAQIGAGPAHLVGVSFGGMIAQTLALRRSDLVLSLSLVATLCTFPENIRQALRERANVARAEGMERIAQLSSERWFTPQFRERRPDIIDRATKSLLLQNAEFHASMWDMIAGLDLEAQLAAITCPTLVIVGERDGNAPMAAGSRIADLIVGSKLHEMADLGHFPPFEAPSEFNALLRAFLESGKVDSV